MTRARRDVFREPRGESDVKFILAIRHKTNKKKKFILQERITVPQKPKIIKLFVSREKHLLKSMSVTLQCPGYPEDTLRSLTDRLPCRETQLKLLLSLMGQPDQYSYPSIFIYGHRATGKSHVVLSIMKDLETSNHLLGPKPFPLDRLLAIFYSVVDSRVAPTASIFSQI